jgi:toxin HigB-1
LRQPSLDAVLTGWMPAYIVYYRDCFHNRVLVTLDVTRNVGWIYSPMILSYRDKRTRDFATGKRVKAFDGISRKAQMKLDQLDAATALPDLDLPGNRLEALKGNRKGQYSIRVNDQWRVCFEWPKGSKGPITVEIVDYH